MHITHQHPRSGRLFPLIALLVTTLLAGCAASAAGTAATPIAATAPLRVALILTGSAADGNWGSAGVEGLRLLRDKYGATIDYKELPNHEDWVKQVPQDWVAALRAYADQGYPLIFAHGRWFDGAVAQIAPAYPNTRFVITGGSLSGPNYASTTLKNEESGYLLGVLAAASTKKNMIGIILGADLVPMLSTSEAFKRGVQATNPQAKVIERRLANPGPSNPTDNMNNPDGANSIAKELIAQGVDILFTHASAANVGVIKQAKDAGVKVINYGKDLTNVAPKVVISCGLQLTPVMMDRMTDLFIKGAFEGKNYIMGMAEGAVNISPLRADVVPEDVQARVRQAQQDLVDGKIKLEIQR